MLPDRPKVLFIGALPPPYMGPTLATQIILESRLRDQFELLHLDTSDHRDIDTLGAWDWSNFYLAFRAYVKMLQMLLVYRPDLVYVPISQTTIGYLKDSIFILMARAFRHKVVCHLRGGNFSNWLDTASSLTRWYVRAVHSQVRVQIVLGATLKPMFAGIVPDSRLFVVPNGKDISYAEKPPPDGKVRVLFLANMIRTKGVLDVLHAVEPVHAECPNVEFIFGGSWEDPILRVEIETFLASHAGLPIRWLGTVSGTAKHEIVNSADLFVFPTYYPPEGHPWVIVEAMAAGLPVISTAQGAIPESVIDGENGFIIAKRNPSELAHRIMLLVGDSDLRHRMGAASRRRYESEFTEARMIDRLATALRSAMSVN